MSKAITWNHLPVSLPEGGLLPHVSARLRRQTIDAVFEMTGGTDRLAAWAQANDDNYRTFVKDMWAPGQAKSANVEVGASKSVEDLLEKLDRAERATLINGEFEVEPA